jgi:AraC family transcriptional regulator
MFAPTATQVVVLGRRVPFFRDSLLNSADHPWAGFSFEEANGCGKPMPKHAWPKTTLLYVTEGDASLDWKYRGSWRGDRCRSGTVCIMRRDAEIEGAVPSSSLRMMALQLDGARLRHVAPDHVEAIERTIVPVSVVQDRRLGSLLSAMRAEVLEGCPSGRLYGEAITLAFLAYLAGNYATYRQPENCERKLSAAQMRGIVDYVRSNLTRDIAVTDLAGLVQISTSHFSRMFRSTFGVTPYQFVMRERVEEAKTMLVESKLSSSQIALTIGFSSQSHFVKVFRRFAGVSPKQYRAGF